MVMPLVFLACKRVTQSISEMSMILISAFICCCVAQASKLLVECATGYACTGLFFVFRFYIFLS